MSSTLRRTVAVAALAFTLGGASPAAASWLQPHTLQDDVPLSEVERPLVIGKSWFVFDLDFSYKRSTSHFLGRGPVNLGITEGVHW